ncbi:MAG: hypothetical protein Q9159_006358 [Coniocarpon cinnabarinum]
MVPMGKSQGLEDDDILGNLGLPVGRWSVTMAWISLIVDTDKVKEIDEDEGEFGLRFDVAQKYRRNTLEYLAHCLRQPSTNSNFEGLHPFIASFDVVGEEVQTHSSQCKYLIFPDQFRPLALTRVAVQCERLWWELQNYIGSCEDEQRRRLSDELPHPDEYMSLRMNTSAVGAAGDCDSMIPLLYLAKSSLQEAIDAANCRIIQAKETFDGAADQLQMKFEYDSERLHAIQSWILPVPYTQSPRAELCPSLHSGRYAIYADDLSQQHTVEL